MRWIRYKEDDEKTWPPTGVNVFIKAHYKKSPSCIMGVGYRSEYGPPHWESGMKIYGNSKLIDDPQYIEWLRESSHHNKTSEK